MNTARSWGKARVDVLHYVYRYYNDNADKVTDHLLYVGMTSNLVARDRAHQYSAAWYPLMTRLVAVEYPDRYAAHDAESASITHGTPFYNLNNNPLRSCVHAARLEASYSRRWASWLASQRRTA